MKYIVVDLNIPFGLKVYGWDLNRSAVFFSVMSKAQWPCQLSGPPLEKGHFIYSSVHVSSCLVGMWTHWQKSTMKFFHLGKRVDCLSYFMWPPKASELPVNFIASFYISYMNFINMTSLNSEVPVQSHSNCDKTSFNN